MSISAGGSEFGNRSPGSPLCRDVSLPAGEQEEERAKTANEVETRSPALHSKHWAMTEYFAWNGWDGMGQDETGQDGKGWGGME